MSSQRQHKEELVCPSVVRLRDASPPLHQRWQAGGGSLTKGNLLASASLGILHDLDIQACSEGTSGIAPHVSNTDFLEMERKGFTQSAVNAEG